MPKAVASYEQMMFYPESNNRAKFIREESHRPDEDTLDAIDLVDFFDTEAIEQ